MKKRLTALLLALCLALTAVPVSAGAAAGQQVSAGSATAMAGSSTSITLKAENFSNIAALDVYVYYDAEVFTVSSTARGYKLSGAQYSANIAEAGAVKLSAMSLNGISGTGTLLTLYLDIKADAAPGTYPITVAIGRAHDTGLAQAEVGGVSGTVTVTPWQETETFTPYGYGDRNTLQKGDILSWQVTNGSCYPFVSGEFTLEYDYTHFAFDSVVLDPSMTGEGAVYSVNSSLLGQVRIAYAKDTPVNNYELFTVKLKVIADLDGTTTIQTTANNVYRENLKPYLPGSHSAQLQLTKLPAAATPSKAFLRTEELAVGRQNKGVFCLEAGAGVAAADFAVTYDPAVLRCVGVTMAAETEAKGGMVVINDSFADGIIRFSYVNAQGYGKTELPLVEILWEPLRSPVEHYTVSLSGTGVVDAQYNSIGLEYVTDTGCIFVQTEITQGCGTEGYTAFVCACGEEYSVGPGKTHSFGPWTVLQPPQVEQTGTKERVCDSCGYRQTGIIPALTFAPGDVDCDGDTDTDDAVYLLLHVMFGSEDYPTAAGMDLNFNGDGDVDTDDAVYLLLHVMFGPEDYPLYGT